MSPGVPEGPGLELDESQQSIDRNTTLDDNSGVSSSLENTNLSADIEANVFEDTTEADSVYNDVEIYQNNEQQSSQQDEDCDSVSTIEYEVVIESRDPSPDQLKPDTQCFVGAQVSGSGDGSGGGGGGDDNVSVASLEPVWAEARLECVTIEALASSLTTQHMAAGVCESLDRRHLRALDGGIPATGHGQAKELPTAPTTPTTQTLIQNGVGRRHDLKLASALVACEQLVDISSAGCQRLTVRSASRARELTSADRIELCEAAVQSRLLELSGGPAQAQMDACQLAQLSAARPSVELASIQLAPKLDTQPEVELRLNAAELLGQLYELTEPLLTQPTELPTPPSPPSPPSLPPPSAELVTDHDDKCQPIGLEPPAADSRRAEDPTEEPAQPGELPARAAQLDQAQQATTQRDKPVLSIQVGQSDELVCGVASKVEISIQQHQCDESNDNDPDRQACGDESEARQQLAGKLAWLENNRWPASATAPGWAPRGPTIEDELERELDEEPPFESRQVSLKCGLNPRDEYALGAELGRGKFGTVFRCVELATGRQLAAKFVLTRRAQDRDDVRREVQIMSKLQHKRLLQLYDAYDDNLNEMCLITELIEGGELFERMVADDFEHTERKAAIFMRQICEGVEYMHSVNIVHLDMKPENILCISRTGNRIKLIDFGLARELNADEPLRVMFGTPDFVAPEVLAYDLISMATDMWSVGVICYVLLSGLSPFMGDSDMETMANVSLATYDFEDESFEPVSDLAKDFITRLLLREQSKRMSAGDCLRHAWLARGGAELEAAVRSRRESMASIKSLPPGGLAIGADELTGSSAWSTPSTPPSASMISLDKRKLKKYVIRRKWHKTVNAIMALSRMGANLARLAS